MQDSDSSWLLQNYPALQRISRASSILQEAKQLSTTTFPHTKSNESMGPSPESKKPLRVMGINFAVEGSAIYNLIMHAYIPQEYDVPQILNIDNTGQKLYED